MYFLGFSGVLVKNCTLAKVSHLYSQTFATPELCAHLYFEHHEWLKGCPRPRSRIGLRLSQCACVGVIFFGVLNACLECFAQCWGDVS